MAFAWKNQKKSWVTRFLDDRECEEFNDFFKNNVTEIREPAIVKDDFSLFVIKVISQSDTEFYILDEEQYKEWQTTMSG